MSPLKGKNNKKIETKLNRIKNQTKPTKENIEEKITNNNENSKPIQQNNFDPKKWDEEDANIGDLAPNPLIKIPTSIEFPLNSEKKDNSSNLYLPSSAPEQWRTTCNIKFYEPKLPDKAPPRLNLKPYHIFGYREKDAHNNIRYLDNNLILYPAGKIGIIQNLTNKQQKYLVGHKYEICSLCVNYQKNLIATGEEYYKNENDNDNNTTVRIWDSKSLEEKANIIIPYNGVRALSFSLNDKYLICCCLDEKYTVALIDVGKQCLVDFKDGSDKKILGITFKNDNEFATVGLNHFKFWNINQNENKLYFKDYTNTLENFDIKLGTISLMKDLFVTGGSLGYITLWKDNVNLKTVKCHNSTIDCLYSDNKIIISGARDKTLTVLDSDLTILKKINLDIANDLIINFCPRAIDILQDERMEKGIKKVLLGISSGEILELIFNVNILGDEKPEIKIYNSSHFSPNSSEINEITSISYWKKSNMLNLFVTTCEDKTIRFWDLENKKQNNFFKINEDIKPTSSTFSIDESKFVVGFETGMIRFYSTIDFHIEKELRERLFPITVIKYSKDNDLFACASKDERQNNIIDIYFSKSYNKYCTLTGEIKEIKGLDWSEDGKHIAAFSLEKECRIFSVVDKFMISDYSSVDFKEWHTWSLGYGWPLKGYYDTQKGIFPICACERFKFSENSNYFIAIGNFAGCVQLYKYPIANKNQKYISNIIEHGKRITHIKFGKIENKDILITAGSDGLLIAWEIEQI